MLVRVETPCGRAGEGNVRRQARRVRAVIVEIENQVGRDGRRDQQAAYRGEHARKHAVKVDCSHPYTFRFVLQRRFSATFTTTMNIEARLKLTRARGDSAFRK